MAEFDYLDWDISQDEISEDRLKEAKRFFTQGNKTSDAIIQVDDHKLHVDMNIISLASATLASEFQPRPDQNSPPCETNKAVAKLVGPVDHIVDMLSFIYPNLKNVVDNDNVEYLLPLAAKHKLLYLQQVCEKVIVEAVPKLNCSSSESKIESEDYYYRGNDKERLLRYFVLADKHKLVGLRKGCMDKLVKCFYSSDWRDTPTRRLKAFQQLDPSTRWEILRNRLFYLEDEYGRVTDNLEDL